MKSIITIYLFFQTFIYSQTIKGIILDSITNKPLSTANISFTKNYGGTNSNLIGEYKINIENKQNDTLKISYTGFKPKLIPLNQYTENKIYNLDIKLELLENKIDEIVIIEKIKKYNLIEKLKTVNEGDIRMFAMTGGEYAFRFKNKKNEKGRLKNVKIHFRRNPKANKLSQYRVKFYSIDSITRKPDAYLLKKDIIISPKNKTYVYNLDVEEQKIPFLEDGIFVGVELIDPNNEINNGDIVGPGLKFTRGENQFSTYINYRGRKWNLCKDRDLVKNKCINILLDLTILRR